MQLQPEQIRSFQEGVWEYYRKNARRMPWRQDPTPYKVLVSELMLQQTQVSRVIPKFDAFMYTYTDIESLASASLADVLRLWSGLGYNRRAKYLHQTAQILTSKYSSQLPRERSELTSLPGIGTNTAGAILAYAFEQPVVFIETNIRTVLFHHFFPDTHENVSDKELEYLTAQTLDTTQPREWYWALMDYGAFLKKTAGSRVSSSRHYVKQSPLRGSVREMRGKILKELIGQSLSRSALAEVVDADARFESALTSLVSEGFITIQADNISLTGSGKTS